MQMNAYISKKTVCALSLLCLLWSCGESSEPPPKPKVVSQKIVGATEDAQTAPKPVKLPQKKETPVKTAQTAAKQPVPQPAAATARKASVEKTPAKVEPPKEMPSQKEAIGATGQQALPPGTETPGMDKTAVEFQGVKSDSASEKIDVLTAEEINEVLKLKARKGVASGAAPSEALSPPGKTSTPFRIKLLGYNDAYNPEGKTDPFKPLFQEKAVPKEDKKKKTRRIPLTPLEKVDLGQLKLSAVIRAPSGNKAMVEESNGKGYVIERGTFIGINSGVVSKILNDRVVIEEEYENALGELQIRKRELRLNKPLGE